MRTIHVRGEKKLSVPPDTVELYITIESFHPDYSVMTLDLERRLQQLSEDMKQLGFQEDDLKTVDFRIQTRYHYQNNQRIFEGYEGVQKMVLHFPFEKAQLNQVIHQLTNSIARPLLDLTFTLRDPESLKQALLTDALHDARNKAVIMAEALDVRVGMIQKMTEITSDQIIFRQMPATYAMQDASMEFAPLDLELSVVVETVWGCREIA